MDLCGPKIASNITHFHNWRLRLVLGVTVVISLCFASTTPAQDNQVVVKQWSVLEMELITSNNYSNSQKYLGVTLTATFDGPGGISYAVPGFWDGGNTWRIRFSPTVPGQWSYTINCSDNQLDAPGNDGSFVAVAPTNADIADNPNYRGFLKISSDKHYLSYADSTPFFWMGGTAWRGYLKNMAFDPDPKDEGPDVAEFRYYVDNRKSKNFTVIQIVAGNPIDANAKNEGGSIFNVRYSEINPVYFQWFDKRIQYVIDQGMVPVILGHWAAATADVSLADLERYWKYIIARYQAYNVIWVISGEYGFVEDLNKVRSLANYVHSTDILNHLTTIHPRPNPPNAAFSSAKHFFGEAWIDFHLHQTWNQAATRSTMVTDYKRMPATPAVNAEAGYDGLWGWTRDMVREDAWAVYMSGGAGYTYGANGIWNWNDGCCDNQGTQPPRWYDVIDLKSSFDMQRIVKFFSWTQWWKLMPRDDLVSTGYALAQPGKEYVVYLPSPTASSWLKQQWEKLFAYCATVTVDLSEVSGTTNLNAEWFNPKTGETKDVGTTPGGAQQSFTAPFTGDAVLYIYKP